MCERFFETKYLWRMVIVTNEKFAERISLFHYLNCSNEGGEKWERLIVCVCELRRTVAMTRWLWRWRHWQRWHISLFFGFHKNWHNGYAFHKWYHNNNNRKRAQIQPQHLTLHNFRFAALVSFHEIIALPRVANGKCKDFCIFVCLYVRVSSLRYCLVKSGIYL